jgi:hypothetical protein
MSGIPVLICVNFLQESVLGMLSELPITMGCMRTEGIE